MRVFDLGKMKSFPYDQRERNVFYQADEFKARIIELPPGGMMPACEMASYVIFVVLDGKASVTVDSTTVELSEKQCLITGPATLSMRTDKGVRLTGIQIVRTQA
jgi:quercetin dioxygenase-like cupin family protein